MKLIMVLTIWINDFCFKLFLMVLLCVKSVPKLAALETVPISVCSELLQVGEAFLASAPTCCCISKVRESGLSHWK